MASPSLKKMGVAGGIQEGNYASSNNLPTRGMINRELGLTLLPGSQISGGPADSRAQGTQVAITDHHSGSYSEQALDFGSLINRPHTSENDLPASSTSTSVAGERAGADIPDVDLSSFHVPSIEDFSLDWCFGELGMPTLHNSSDAVAPADFNVELLLEGSCGLQQNDCLAEQSLKYQQPCIEVFKPSNTERFTKSEVSNPQPSQEALATSSPNISSDSLSTQGNCDDNPEPSVQNPPTANSGFEIQLHQLEQKIKDLTKSLQLTNKELADERAEKQKLKKKAKRLAKLLRECAPGKVPVARMLKDVGKIPLDDDDNARIFQDPSPSPNSAGAIPSSRHRHQGQVSPAPVEALANGNAVPLPCPPPLDLTTDEESPFISQIYPSPSDPPLHTASLRDHDSSPLVTLHNRLEKRPLDWLEGSHPVTGAKRQKSLDLGTGNIQALEGVNEARAASSAKGARILKRKEETQARKQKVRVEKKAEEEAKKSTKAQWEKVRNMQRTRNGQKGSKDLLMEEDGQMINPTQGQVQGTETNQGRQDPTSHARLRPDIYILSNDKYNSPQSPAKYSSNADEGEEFYALATELEKAMEAMCEQGGEASDGLGSGLESAMTADEARRIYGDDRLSVDLEAAMLDAVDAEKKELAAELDATSMVTGEGHEHDGDDGPRTLVYESGEESEEE